MADTRTNAKVDLDKSIEEYLQRELVTISEDETVSGAAKMMYENQVGSLVVTDEDGQPKGIITERDIIFRVVASNLDPSVTRTGSVMSSPIKTIDHKATVGDALAVMSQGNIRRLGVKKDEKIIGIVSQRRIISGDYGERVLLPELEAPRIKRCPYCEQQVKDANELSKHIDYVHIGKGLLQGDKRKW